MCHEILSNYPHRNVKLAGVNILLWITRVKILINTYLSSPQARNHHPLVRVKGTLNLSIFTAQGVIQGGQGFFPPSRPISAPLAEF